MQLNIFMRNFAVQKIDIIKGKVVFNKLIVDGVSLLDEFENSLEEQYESEMQSIYLYMEEVANLRSLPKSKFRELKDVKGDVKEYEFKSKHLRVYAIKQSNCKLIVMCGYKNTQDRDIIKFRSLKTRYISSLKLKNENKSRTS